MTLDGLIPPLLVSDTPTAACVLGRNDPHATIGPNPIGHCLVRGLDLVLELEEPHAVITILAATVSATNANGFVACLRIISRR
ncbi:MAG: hypothetical protein J2P57_00250 [Acidimicrobiaceae bacterium]|nr:hypothetical protein [Acidimicrobiaceae bacterium]